MERGRRKTGEKSEGRREKVREGGDLASRHLQYLTGCDELSPFS